MFLLQHEIAYEKWLVECQVHNREINKDQLPSFFLHLTVPLDFLQVSLFLHFLYLAGHSLSMSRAFLLYDFTEQLHKNPGVPSFFYRCISVVTVSQGPFLRAAILVFNLLQYSLIGRFIYPFKKQCILVVLRKPDVRDIFGSIVHFILRLKICLSIGFYLSKNWIQPT